MNRKKILFISSWYPNKLEPTNGNFVQRHAEAVFGLHDVEVLHAIGDDKQKEKLIVDESIVNGIRTVILYYKNSKNPLKNFVRRMNAYRKGFKMMQKPDLVHANVMHNNLLFAVYLKKRFGIPFVITEHWTAFQADNLQKTPSQVLKIARFIGNQASYVLPVSENLRQSLSQIGIVSPKKVISNVVDTDIFTIGEHQNNITKFLHVSSLIPRKKADRIVAVCQKLHEEGYLLELEIGGDGDYQKLQQQVIDLGGQSYIKVFGEISYKEVAEKMRNSDCLILFSENETQGCVIVESFSCGIPVISTAVGGVPEFVKKNFGLLIEKNNEDELYEAMKKIVEKKIVFEERETLRKYVTENFSKDAVATQFSNVYAKILHSG